MATQHESEHTECSREWWEDEQNPPTQHVFRCGAHASTDIHTKRRRSFETLILIPDGDGDGSWLVEFLTERGLKGGGDLQVL